MKKLFVYFFCLYFALFFSACGNGDKSSAANGTTLITETTDDTALAETTQDTTLAETTVKSDTTAISDTVTTTQTNNNGSTPCLYFVRLEDGYEYINNKGEVVTNYKFNNAHPFNDGMGQVLKNHLYGFVDANGKLAIPCIYDNAGNYSEGLCAVKKVGGKWGYIDKTGKVVIDFQYYAAYDFNDGIAGVVKDNKFQYINTNNEVVFSAQQENPYDAPNKYSEGFIGYSGKYYYDLKNKKNIDVDWSLLVDDHDQILCDFSGGIALIKSTNAFLKTYSEESNVFPDGYACFYINTDGQIISDVYDDAYNFSEGLAIVRKDGENFCINTKGEIVFKFKGIYGEFHEGLAPFKTMDNTMGFVDTTGKVVIPAQYFYNNACEYKFQNGIAFVLTDDKVCYIDKNNKIIYEFNR